MKYCLFSFLFLAANAFSNHNNILEVEGVLPPVANNITLTAMPIEIESLPTYFDALYAQSNACAEADFHLVTPLFDQSEKHALFPFYENYFEHLFASACNKFTLINPNVRSYVELSMGFIYARARRI